MAVKMVPCKLCGKDTPEGNEYCHVCIWKAKWPAHILNSPELAARRKRSHLVHLVSLDTDAPFAVFGTPGEAECSTSLQQCTCKDFAFGRGKRPCKHIFRLAEELGLFQCEHFEPGEDDYTLQLDPNHPLNRRLCLPEALRDADEALVEKYVTILYFIVKGEAKGAKRWSEVSEKLREQLCNAAGDEEKEKDIKKKMARAKRTYDDCKKLSFYEKKDELLDQLEELGIIETLVPKTVTVEEAEKRYVGALSETATRKTVQMTLYQAQKILDVYEGIYPVHFRQQVATDAFALIDDIIEKKRRSERILRPHNANATPDWAFHVPAFFNDALDIKLITRMQNLIEYTAWTQGTNFAFDAGDMLYRDAETYQKGTPALQIVSAKPARGTKIEGLNLGADVEQSAEATQQKREEPASYAGSVTYRDFEAGDTKTVTQIDFVKMLIGPASAISGKAR